MKKLLLIFSILSIHLLGACNHKNSQISAVEVVIYKSKEGVTKEQALKAAKSVNKFISSQKGFVSRTFSETEDSRWIDVLFWESLEDAQNANNIAMKSAVPLKFFETIDEKSMIFLHGKKVFELP